MGRLFTPLKQVAQQPPAAPSYLTSEELACWNEVVALLSQQNTVTEADADAIAVYCTAKVHFLKARKEIEMHGVIIQSRQGYIKNPATTVVNESVRTMTHFFANFGMTPSARAALKQTDPNSGQDALAILLQSNPLMRGIEMRDDS